MRLAFLGVVLVFAAAVAAAPAGGVHVVIENHDGSHVAAQLPLSDAQLAAAKHLWVWSDGLAPRKLDARADVLAELRRTPSRPLDVRVRGWSRSEELAGLRVIAAPQEMWLDVPEPLLPAFALTKEGRATIPVRDPIRMRVVGEKFGTVWEDVAPAARAFELLLREPSADATVAFRASDGALAGRVFALAMMRRRGEAATATRAQFASDDKGVVRIPSLPESEILTLFVTSERSAPQTISGSAADLSRTIRLPAPAQIRGRVVDEEQRPLRDVKVEAEGWVSSDAPVASRDAAVSDDAGVWTVRGLPRGQVMVRATAKGRATFRRRVTLEEGGSLDLGTITMPPSADVVLTVTNTENEPLPNVNVAGDSGFRGTTGKSGSVTLTGLPVDDSSSITLTAAGFAKQTITLALPLPKEERVVLERAFSVLGNVVDDKGAAVSDATAIVTSGMAYRRVDVAADGSFSFDVEPGKEFDLTFESPSAASVSRKEQAGRIGETRNLGTIRLPSGLSVRGRIVDSADSPVAGARVWSVRASAGGTVVAWAGGRVVQATSDGDGNFDLRGLPPGPALLRIDAPDYARTYRPVVVEAEPLDAGAIEVVRGRDVTVKTKHDDARTARIDLRGDWLDADMLTAPVVEGEARLRHVPPGTYKVTVVNARAVVCERTVDVRENSDALVECAPPMLVRGRVLLGGAPAYSGSLSWNRPSETDGLISNRVSAMGALQQNVYGMGSGTVVVPLRADGTFETNELRAGEWQVSWRSPESGGTPDRTFVVPDVADAQIVVEFSGGVIRGRVVDANDRPIAQARVREIQGPLFAMSGAEGSFTLTAVAPGVHRLQASLGARASRVVEVTVEPDQAASEVRLEIDDVERDVLTIRVVGVEGQPKPNAFVFAGRKIMTADANGVARSSFPEGRPGRVIVFADNEWAFGDVGESDDVTLRFERTGAMTIRSKTITGEPQILSARAGDLSWMLERLGTFLTLAPDAPLVIHGLPVGTYEVRIGADVATVAITAGSNATVDLR